MSTITMSVEHEQCPLCGQRDDTYCLHPGPGGDLWTCPACGHDWTVEVTEPAATMDRRTYRTELTQPSGARGRWGLYIEATRSPTARTAWTTPGAAVGPTATSPSA